MKLKMILLSAAVVLFAAFAFSPPGWSIETDSFPVSPGTAHIVSSLEEDDFGWENFFDAKGQLLPAAEVSRAAFIQDDVSMGTAIDLTALAESDTLVQNDVVSAEQDIGNVYVALAPDREGKLMIFGGVERVGDGNGYMTLEFNQDHVALGAGGFGKGQPWAMMGSRTQGDILLRLNFSNGQLAAAEVSRWEGQPDVGSYRKVGMLPEEGCNDAGTLCAVSNDEDIQAGPWMNRVLGGDPSIIPAHRFVEFKINAEALVGMQFVYASLCALTSEDVAFDMLTKEGN